MFQKFNTDTLMGRFIKNLLSKEKIPLLDCVSANDVLIKDCQYIYRNFIIKCVETGILVDDDQEVLGPSEKIYPSYILPQDKNVARFKVICYYNENDIDLYTYSYHSHFHWYDKDTHMHLGNYLRYLRSHMNLDLMPFYNCYNSYEIEDVYLKHPFKTETLHPADSLYPSEFIFPTMPRQYQNNSVPSYVLGNSSQYHVIAVPIKFNKEYTIALECPSEIQLRSIIYGAAGMIHKPGSIDTFYSDDLADSYCRLTGSSFKKPFIYKVKTVDPEMYQRQHDLYLLIQLPISCATTITVLEGNYVDIASIKTNSNSVREVSVYKNLSLLSLNTKETYAFSDRLVEYLLDNVITHLDSVGSDISRTQESLVKLDALYGNSDTTSYSSFVENHKTSSGVWDDFIRTSILNLVERFSNERSFYDQDGYVNKDIEDLFLRKGVLI